MIFGSIMLAAVVTSCSNNETAKTDSKPATTVNDLSGTYTFVNAETKSTDTIKVEKSGADYVIIVNGQSNKAVLKDGAVVSSAEESAIKHADGSATINLAGEISVYKSGSDVLLKRSIPDLGTDSMKLVKL